MVRGQYFAVAIFTATTSKEIQVPCIRTEGRAVTTSTDVQQCSLRAPRRGFSEGTRLTRGRQIHFKDDEGKASRRACNIGKAPGRNMWHQNRDASKRNAVKYNRKANAS
jgi:hypothetical protein